jgi:septum formation protein
MSARLILASASPRRRELLGRFGIEFDIVPSGVPEVPHPGEDPALFACRAAIEKAMDVAGKRPGRWVLGADTVVVIDGRILGKPSDAAEARSMLRCLSGRVHHVLTGVVLIGPDGTVVADLVAESSVEFRELADEEIATYAATGEPLDKAGAYAIQGGAGRFVRNVTGSYSNVIGLPVDDVHKLLLDCGILGTSVTFTSFEPRQAE